MKVETYKNEIKALIDHLRVTIKCYERSYPHENKMPVIALREMDKLQAIRNSLMSLYTEKFLSE